MLKTKKSKYNIDKDGKLRTTKGRHLMPKKDIAIVCNLLLN